MKKIRVPEGMLSAARIAWVEAYRKSSMGNMVDIPLVVIEAALLWLSNNPQVPTDEQAMSLLDYFHSCTSRDWLCDTCVEWQRRCFVQEEPEIPAEIEELMLAKLSNSAHIEEHNKAVLEAYRRGLTRGSRSLRKGEQK